MDEDGISNRLGPADALNIRRVSDLVLIAGKMRPKTVIIAGGDREEDLRLVEAARDHGIVERCLLVGKEAAIRAAAGEIGLPLEEQDIIPTSSPEETAARTAERVQQGGVHIILKGNISTPILNRAMMRIVVRNTISLVTLFDTATIAGGRPILLTDAGVTTVCSYGRMVGLVENAVEVAQTILGIARPRVAILSANEKVIDSLPSTRMGQALSRRAWNGAVVYGPLSLDLAVDPDSVGIKGLGGGGAAEVAGRADILVCPGLDAANILYKLIMESVKYGLGTLASIAVGVAVPYGILSRADNVETKLQSIALCSIAAERMDLSRPRVVGRPREAAGGAEGGAAGGKREAAARPCRILAVEAGAASTRVALYEDDRCLGQADLPGGPPAAVEEFLRRGGLPRPDAVAALGGPPAGGLPLAAAAEGGAAPPPGGVAVVAEVRGGRAEVDERLLSTRPADRGLRLAAALAHAFTVPAFLVDPGPGDAFAVHAAAREMAERSGLRIEETCYVVALPAAAPAEGAAVTVAAARAGRVVDSLSIPLEEGPFRPWGAGALPLEEIERRIEAGDEAARRAVEAAAHRIAGCIGSMGVAAGPEMEAVLLAGDLARQEPLVRSLRKRLGHLFPVLALKEAPGLKALAAGARRVLAGQEQPRRCDPPR